MGEIQVCLLERSPRRGDSDVEQLGLTSDDHAALAGELEVGSHCTSIDLANELAGGIVYPDTVTSASVDAALGVSVDTVRDESRDVGEGLAVLERTILGDIERVDRSRRGQVAAVEAKRDTSVGDVSLVAVRGNRDAVRQSEVVSNNCGSTGLEVVAVHLVPQTRNRTEVLEVAVKGVREVEITVLGADNQVVQRVELTTKVVVEQC